MDNCERTFGVMKTAENSGWYAPRLLSIEWLKPLFDDAADAPLHQGAGRFMDGEMLCLFPEGLGQNKVLTYRGGIIVAEREFLPAESRAANADLEPAVGAHASLECGVVCRWSKIIRHHLHRWVGIDADRA